MASNLESLGTWRCSLPTNLREEEERVIIYASRTLQPAEKIWCTREKEAFGIIWACEQFRPFIIDNRFTVETDHESLKWLKEAKSPPRLRRLSYAIIRI